MSDAVQPLAASDLVNGAAQSWLDQLRPASFRGVPFQVDSIDWQAGDNVVLREYPFQDLPTVFRMGAGSEEIKLSAYVIGDDYHLQRDALMAALTGEGVLVHPTAGAMRVFVTGKYSVKENPTEAGGMARFDLAFVRAELRRYPVVASNPQAQVVTAASAARAAAADAFAAQWATAGAPGWVAEQAVARVKATLDVLWTPLASATRTLGEFNSELIASYQALRGGLDSLLAAPRQLADAVATLYELPGDLSNAAARDLQAAFAWVWSTRDRIKSTGYEVSVVPAVGAGLVMYGLGNAGGLSIDTAARSRLDALTAASDLFFEALATAAWAQATANIELASYDEAMAMRQAIGTQVNRLLQAASVAAPATAMPASSLHDTLLGVYTAALGDLQARSRNLVALTTYTPTSWQPVWYVSYRLYGTASYADEILAMNPHIQHPMLVPPGKALRVVRHD